MYTYHVCDSSNLDSRFSRVGSGSLRIDGLQAEDAGSYTCRATNQEDSIDADATLTVHGTALIWIAITPIFHGPYFALY